MEAALGWIGELITWVVEWLPHLGICRATHGGVKFVCGKRIKEIRPGLYWWWPKTTEIEVVPTARQALDLPAQRLTTKDGKTVALKVVPVYLVVDVIKALVDCVDFDETAEEVAQEAAAEIVLEKDWDDLRSNLLGTVRQQITLKCRQLLKPYGLKVEKCRISDFALTRMLSVDGQPIIIPDNETDE